jgi:Uma2 family endonuclease
MVMLTQAKPGKLTYQDLLAMPEDGKRHELVNGVHYVSPAPRLRHQAVLANLFRVLDGYIRKTRVGSLYFAPVDVVLSQIDVLEPDILFVTRERLAILTEMCVQGAPDLVVEVLSPGTRRRDATVKLRAYRKFGVGEYWMVDPHRETVAVHRGPWLHLALDLPRERDDGADGELTSPLFPGLSVTLDEIFE